MKDFSIKADKGFTLVETLIALALISVISMIVMGALSPWIGFKQKIDTERKLSTLRAGFTAAYQANAMEIDTAAEGTFRGLTQVLPDAAKRCSLPSGVFTDFSAYLSESPQQLEKDGHANNWCLFISTNKSTTQEGSQIWYRNIAVVSTGANGVLDAGTEMTPDGNIVLAGDDVGTLVSGREIQTEKLRETLRRMNRLAQAYETYFTNRYLANVSRDISIYYFSTEYDTSGSILSTGGAWQAAATALKPIGLGGTDVLSAWEKDNNIEVENYNQAQNGITVRSPATSGTGVLPYTALLRAKLPSPPGGPGALYLSQVVVGNY